uniref:Carbamoyl-phosphate synthase large chain n=1 Tax=Lygus hesperus TaxID=30085 RepID=A0A0A9Y4H5_LYGHE
MGDLINNGLYSYRDGDKRIYAMRLFRIGKQLGLSERKLINKLIRHFHINEQSCLTVGPVTSLSCLLKLIEASDSFQRNPRQQRHHQGNHSQYQGNNYQTFHSRQQNGGENKWAGNHQRRDFQENLQPEAAARGLWDAPIQQCWDNAEEVIDSTSIENIEEQNVQLDESESVESDQSLADMEFQFQLNDEISDNQERMQTGDNTEPDSQKLNCFPVQLNANQSINNETPATNYATQDIRTETHELTGAPAKIRLRSFTERTKHSSSAAYNLHFQVAHVVVGSAAILKFKPSIVSSAVISIPGTNLQGKLNTSTDEVFPEVHWVWDPGGDISWLMSSF